MQLPNNLAPFSEFLAKLPQVSIAKAVNILIVVYIAYLLAQFTWQIVPSNHVPAVITHSSAAQPNLSKSAFNVAQFSSLNLFGEYSAEEKTTEQLPEVQDVPETRLNLTLSGVVASSEPKNAAAIIEQGGKQETYGIGDKITGTRAQLEQVHADRVIIKQSGRLETLMLEGFDYNKSKPVTYSSSSRGISPQLNQSPRRSRTQSANSIDKRGDKKLTSAVNQLKNDIAQNPGKISDYLKISPKRVQGKLVGYRLMPGRNPDFFKSSGLKAGDVATQINGLDLSLPSESAQALKLLKEASDIALLVDRNGDLTEILFSITQ